MKNSRLSEIRTEEDILNSNLNVLKEEKATLLISNKPEATQNIADLVKEAMDLIKQAEVLAEEYSILFDFSLAYGMGGSYYPADFDESDSETGWVSSSAHC